MPAERISRGGLDRNMLDGSIEGRGFGGGGGEERSSKTLCRQCHNTQSFTNKGRLKVDIYMLPSPPSTSRSDTPDTPSPSPSPLPTHLPAPAFLTAHYKPPRSHSFTPMEVSQGINKLNRETTVNHIIKHPYNAIVKYPETGDAPDVAIAHVFNMNPHPDHFCHPCFNFQYSLGGGHGGHDGVICRLLKSTTGSPVICSKLRTMCKGLQYCSFRPPSNAMHSFTSRQVLLIKVSTLDATAHTPQDDAHHKVFLKTIGFYCALVDKGCTFSSTTDFPDSSDTIQQENNTLDNAENDNIDHTRSSCHKRKVPRCHRRLVLKFNNFHQPYIHTMYLHIENFAKSLGIGPLAPYSKNKLHQGALLEPASKCNMMYDIYVPNDPANCPQVLIVSRHPHNHPPPLPIKTPPQIVKCFESLLQRLKWKLADTTPRQLPLDSGFMQGLRQVLSWNSYKQDPSPHDLHPSLGNFDHLRRLINVLRSSHFPHGTGFQGAQQLNDTVYPVKMSFGSSSA
ncbi:hypothetical protein BDN67DRAFT_984400 [Paxillus ammoniavirescens]|nr:hypothetical protein BDN67DRAFT_984400 [Paxillus ammoniavirescens]